MIKYLGLGFCSLLFFVFYAHAMEKETESVRLAQLPRNASNRIAHFLGWETQAACIRRTRDDIKGKKRILYNNVHSVDATKKAMFCNFAQKQYSELNVYRVKSKNDMHVIFNMFFDVGYKFTKLDFNQQGTILLVRYIYSPCPKEWFENNENIRSYKKLRLFKLNAIVDYETKKLSIEAKEENALQDYLRHHVVCKKY